MLRAVRHRPADAACNFSDAQSRVRIVSQAFFKRSPGFTKLIHQDSLVSLQTQGRAWVSVQGRRPDPSLCRCFNATSASSAPINTAAECATQVQLRWAGVALAMLLSWLGPLSPHDVAYARARLTAEESQTIELFKQNTPSVVFITNLASRRDTFTVNLLAIPQGAGSGFIWDTDGHVVTNYHVIKGASELQVTLTGGQEVKAKVVGFDEDKDVAVLKIQLSDEKKEMLHPMAVGNSGDLLVGQRVFAIGNPFGLDHTLTTGVISGTGREITSGNTGRPISDVIQTDAAINPGNSGGPLIDSGGELIGVNTAIYTASGGNSGVGFAIPIDAVKGSVEQIIRTGRVVHPVIGISFAPDQASDELGVKGILVLDAREGGPAWKAGIHGTRRDDFGRLVYGDIITAFNGAQVKNMSDLYKNLDKCSVGDEIDVEVLREQDKQHVRILLGSSA